MADVQIRSTFPDGFILQYIGSILTRTSYGVEVGLGYNGNPTSCGPREYAKVIQEYNVLKVMDEH